MRAAAWLGEHGAQLTGLPAEDAAAVVRDAGLTPRTILPGDVVTLAFRSDRVNLECDADGRVREVRAG